MTEQIQVLTSIEVFPLGVHVILCQGEEKFERHYTGTNTGSLKDVQCFKSRESRLQG